MSSSSLLKLAGRKVRFTLKDGSIGTGEIVSVRGDFLRTDRHQPIIVRSINSVEVLK